MREYYDLEHELSTQVLEYYAELEVFYEYSGKISHYPWVLVEKWVPVLSGLVWQNHWLPTMKLSKRLVN